MAEPYIVSFLEWVREALGNPAASKRVTDKSLLRDLHTHHVSVYERLLRVTGGESTLGYTETDIVLTEGQSHYSFPGNFRQFHRLERWNDGDRDKVIASMGTVAMGSNHRGIVIVSPRQFIVQPVPTETKTWVMKYQRAPIKLHYGHVSSVTELRQIGLETGPMIDGQGELVLRNNYYAGEHMHFWENSGVGGPWTLPDPVQITSYVPGGPYVKLRDDPSSPLGEPPNVGYEFRPILPEGTDKLIAISVALGHTASSVSSERRSLLMREWKELFAAAKSHYRTTTVDRPPAKRIRRPAVSHDPFFG